MTLDLILSFPCHTAVVHLLESVRVLLLWSSQSLSCWMTLLAASSFCLSTLLCFSPLPSEVAKFSNYLLHFVSADIVLSWMDIKQGSGHKLHSLGKLFKKALSFETNNKPREKFQLWSLLHLDKGLKLKSFVISNPTLRPWAMNHKRYQMKRRFRFSWATTIFGRNLVLRHIQDYHEDESFKLVAFGTVCLLSPLFSTKTTKRNRLD